jgi:hypothetical protein
MVINGNAKTVEDILLKTDARNLRFWDQLAQSAVEKHIPPEKGGDVYIVENVSINHFVDFRRLMLAKDQIAQIAEHPIQGWMG